MQNLDYYQAIAKEAIKNDKDRDVNIQQCRDIVALRYELPEALKRLDWMRTFKVSAPKDGISAAIRTFSTLLPSLNIHPNNASDMEHKRVEDIEDALVWHFRKVNHRGIISPLERIVQSAVEVGKVAFQVKYLPYELKGQTGARAKALKRQGDFAYIVHAPESIHPRYSQEALESVVKSCVMTVAELERELGAENEVIKQIIEDIREDKKNLQADKETTTIAYYDYVDYEQRVKWAELTDELDGGGGDSYEIMREEHKLGFLPFIYRESREPLLQSVIDSNSWENQNILRSLQYALLVSTVAQARTVVKTSDGQPREVDYTDPAAQLVLRPNEDAAQFPPAQTDPNLERQVMQGEQNITQQMNTRALQAATDIASSAPFATFNAIMQTAIASLSDQTQMVEKALEDGFEQQLRWIDYSKIPLIGSRYKNRSGFEFDSRLASGAQIGIAGAAEDLPDNIVQFDPDALEIDVKLRPDTPSDRQTRLIQAIQLVDKLHFSVDDALEAYGLDDMERNEESWQKEQMTNAVFQAKIQQIMANAQLQVQMAGQQQQAQMQQEQAMAQQNQMQQQAQGGMFENQGSVPTSMGGAGAQEQAPGITREQIAGETQQGQGL
jgi:hypothetical protein